MQSNSGQDEELGNVRQKSCAFDAIELGPDTTSLFFD
jgi:hypothetical protein